MARTDVPQLTRPKKPPKLGKRGKLPRTQRFSIKPRGPRHLHLGQRATHVGLGPGEPPIGFVGAHTSRTEWLVYWGLAVKTGKPKDPRVPPFVGAPDGSWRYQVSDDIVGGRIPGGSVTDFQVQTPTGWIGIRVDTERWHIFAGANQQMKDLFIKTHLKGVQKVITLYEQDFISDDTGAAVIALVALALQGIEKGNPILTGTARRQRPK